MFRLLEIGEVIEAGDLSWDDSEIWKAFAENWIGRVHEKGDYPIKREVESEVKSLKTQLQLSRDIRAERDAEVDGLTSQVMILNSDGNELYLKEKAEKEELIADLTSYACDAEIWNEPDNESLIDLFVKHGIAKRIPYNIDLHGIELQDEYDIEEGDEITWFGDDNPGPKEILKKIDCKGVGDNDGFFELTPKDPNEPI